jgi:hypothetical protein
MRTRRIKWLQLLISSLKESAEDEDIAQQFGAASILIKIILAIEVKWSGICQFFGEYFHFCQEFNHVDRQGRFTSWVSHSEEEEASSLRSSVILISFHTPVHKICSFYRETKS